LLIQRRALARIGDYTVLPAAAVILALLTLPLALIRVV
jgi:hypothetical protein